MTYEDHLGQKFESLSAMARYWHIASSTLENRLNNMHLTVEQALTYTTTECKALTKLCKDHLGNIFPSKKAMCKHYNIPSQVYFGRIKIGWSLEKTLTTPVDKTPKNAKEAVDHLGQTFPTISAMCKHWNMKRSTYNARIKSGWSVKDALTTPCEQLNIKQQKCEDHLGNKYESLNAMCRAYNITHHTFTTRTQRLGWSLEKALTTPNVINAIECTDNMGHTFPTLRDMCHYYRIPDYYLQGKNIPAEELPKLLTSGFHKNDKIADIIIKKRIDNFYFLVIKNHHEIIITFEQLLQIYHNHDFEPIPKNKISDKNLQINKCIEFPYYDVTYNNKSEIWTYWKIINYRKNSNFGLNNKSYDRNKENEL